MFAGLGTARRKASELLTDLRPSISPPVLASADIASLLFSSLTNSHASSGFGDACAITWPDDESMLARALFLAGTTWSHSNCRSRAHTLWLQMDVWLMPSRPAVHS